MDITETDRDEEDDLVEVGVVVQTSDPTSDRAGLHGRLVQGPPRQRPNRDPRVAAEQLRGPSLPQPPRCGRRARTERSRFYIELMVNVNRMWSRRPNELETGLWITHLPAGAAMGVIALVAPLARRVKLKAMSRAWIILKLVPTARSVVDFIRLLASDR